jgi:DNA-binding transcriptional LysR family regulator
VVKISGPIVTSHREVLKTAAVRGLGIAYGPVAFFRDELKAGRIVEVLSKFKLPDATIYAVYPTGQQRSAKVLAFNDFMSRHFAAAGVGA